MGARGGGNIFTINRIAMKRGTIVMLRSDALANNKTLGPEGWRHPPKSFPKQGVLYSVRAFTEISEDTYHQGPGIYLEEVVNPPHPNMRKEIAWKLDIWEVVDEPNDSLSTD